MFRSRTFRYVFVLCLAGIIVSPPAFAQGANDAVRLISSVQSTIREILKTFLGIGAVGAIGFASYHLIEGSKPDAAKKFIWAFVAFAVGEVLLFILSRFSVGTGGDFTHCIGYGLESLLMIVAMLSMVGIVIKMMHGDEESYRRLYTWLIALIAGMSLIEIVMANAPSL